ncbi:hypothetical protein CYMTET_34512 [Cymbomonas tetramitiformis]|uniref:non-specific serine/threonine protein kinase n=1 Tax=Cymbomonas tetramitiformis TaxID=36881 RepID=A0AAE0FAZ7_9CHLO|nr:hypothetical protein CYMTET_34512 [Cymbomonas tetramitiformis]
MDEVAFSSQPSVGTSEGEAPPEEHDEPPDAPDDDEDELGVEAISEETETFLELSKDGRFGRYDEMLGQGASKAVYKGFDEVKGIEVAWNKSKLPGLENPKEYDRLRKEVETLQKLRHPNIIKIYKYWVDEGCSEVNFITEIFSCGTIRQYSQKHKHIDLKVLKNWAWQILEGLVYLHTREPIIIHRDLKSDNIFINGANGEVKIADLGASTMLDNRTRGCQTTIGTHTHMAPEMYGRDYDEKVDIYAFGMCLLEVVTRDKPYTECKTSAHIMRKVLRLEPPEALARVKNEELRNFITLCIQPNPELRPTASELLLHKFFKLEKKGKKTVVFDLHVLVPAVGNAKSIAFTYNPLSDTPQSVAREMAGEFRLLPGEEKEVLDAITMEVDTVMNTLPSKELIEDQSDVPSTSRASSSETEDTHLDSTVISGATSVEEKVPAANDLAAVAEEPANFLTQPTSEVAALPKVTAFVQPVDFVKQIASEAVAPPEVTASDKGADVLTQIVPEVTALPELAAPEEDDACLKQTTPEDIAVPEAMTYKESVVGLQQSASKAAAALRVVTCEEALIQNASDAATPPEVLNHEKTVDSLSLVPSEAVTTPEVVTYEAAVDYSAQESALVAVSNAMLSPSASKKLKQALGHSPSASELQAEAIANSEGDSEAVQIPKRRKSTIRPLTNNASTIKPADSDEEDPQKFPLQDFVRRLSISKTGPVKEPDTSEDSLRNASAEPSTPENGSQSSPPFTPPAVTAISHSAGGFEEQQPPFQDSGAFNTNTSAISKEIPILKPSLLRFESHEEPRVLLVQDDVSLSSSPPMISRLTRRHSLDSKAALGIVAKAALEFEQPLALPVTSPLLLPQKCGVVEPDTHSSDWEPWSGLSGTGLQPVTPEPSEPHPCTVSHVSSSCDEGADTGDLDSHEEKEEEDEMKEFEEQLLREREKLEKEHNEKRKLKQEERNRKKQERQASRPRLTSDGVAVVKLAMESSWPLEPDGQSTLKLEKIIDVEASLPTIVIHSNPWPPPLKPPDACDREDCDGESMQMAVSPQPARLENNPVSYEKQKHVRERMQAMQANALQQLHLGPQGCLAGEVAKEVKPEKLVDAFKQPEKTPDTAKLAEPSEVFKPPTTQPTTKTGCALSNGTASGGPLEKKSSMAQLMELEAKSLGAFNNGNLRSTSNGQPLMKGNGSSKVNGVANGASVNGFNSTVQGALNGHLTPNAKGKPNGVLFTGATTQNLSFAHATGIQNGVHKSVFTSEADASAGGRTASFGVGVSMTPKSGINGH